MLLQPETLPSPLAGEGLQRELVQIDRLGEGSARLRANDSLRRGRGASPHPHPRYCEILDCSPLPQGERGNPWLHSHLRNKLARKKPNEMAPK